MTFNQLNALRSRLPLVGLLCLFPLTSVGCGGESEGVEVQGTVTVNGQPVDNGAITFVPSAGGSKKGGTVIEGGKYTVPASVGLAAGSYKVEILWQKPTGRKYKSDDTGEMVEETTQALPPNYNTSTTLTADLTDETTQKDFSLDVPSLK